MNWPKEEMKADPLSIAIDMTQVDGSITATTYAPMLNVSITLLLVE